MSCEARVPTVDTLLGKKGPEDGCEQRPYKKKLDKSIVPRNEESSNSHRCLRSASREEGGAGNDDWRETSRINKK